MPGALPAGMNLTRTRASCLGALGVVAAYAVACGGSSSSGAGDEVRQARSPLARDTAPVVSAEDAETLRADDAAFAGDLYRTVSPTFDGQNMFFSPHSISLALAMASVGARGKTATQMASALHFTLPPERLHPAYDALDLALSSRGAGAPAGTHPFTLRVVNSMWAAPNMMLAPPFLDTLATSYGAGVRLTDFGAAPDASRESINRWVSDETNARIPALLSKDDITGNTRLVLVNAVYFKAAWASPFSKGATVPATFHARAGDRPVDMMNATGRIPYAEGDGWKAVALPYEGNELSFVAVLPDDLASFEASLTGDPFRTIAPAVPPPSTAVDIHLPRFKIDGASFGLKNVLKARGMVDAFDPDLADFSGMAPAERVFIGSVVHQTFVTVDEDGTEAAAATAVVFSDAGSVSAPPEKVIDVTFDRPFVFFVRDNATGAILFLGRIAAP